VWEASAPSIGGRRLTTLAQAVIAWLAECQSRGWRSRMKGSCEGRHPGKAPVEARAWRQEM
jgi:hypothetical protein